MSMILLHHCPRSSLFLTSKLGPKNHGLERAQDGVDTVLRELQTEYLDLFLLHWPGVQVTAWGHSLGLVALFKWCVSASFHVCLIWFCSNLFQ